MLGELQNSLQNYMKSSCARGSGVISGDTRAVHPWCFLVVTGSMKVILSDIPPFMLEEKGGGGEKHIFDGEAGRRKSAGSKSSSNATCGQKRMLVKDRSSCFVFTKSWVRILTVTSG